MAPPLHSKFWIVYAILPWFCASGLAQRTTDAAGPSTLAERYLFSMANHERMQRGLPALQWDAALTRGAAFHARQMAANGTISHQYPGEPELSARAAQAGAKFSKVDENVAESPTAVIIHEAWMHSRGHRENLLDPAVDAVGIAVVSRGGQLFAVEDFDRRTPAVSLSEQEHTVHGLLATPGLQVIEGAADARKTCTMDTGYAGQQKPWFVMRFTSSDLTRLPDVLQTKLRTGRYRQASIGACATTDSAPFTGYSIAVLLYP
jgi:hypothetical protein